MVASAVTDDALIRRVRPLLTDLCLRTGEAVTLAVARRFNLVYADQVEPPNMMAPSWLDKPLPLHATSGGKAFLAWLGRDERDAILPAGLARYTDHTVTDREELERELAEFIGAAAARDRPGGGQDGGRDPRPARLIAGARTTLRSAY